MNRSRFLALAALALISACDRFDGSDSQAVGSARAYIASVPPSVNCIRIVAAGGRTVIDDFDVVPNQSATLTLDNLPVGNVSFTGFAYDNACSAVAGAQPSWSSSPTPATILPGKVINLALVMEEVGGAAIGISFDTDAGVQDLALPAPDLVTSAIFVSTLGDDDNTGLTAKDPVQTIATALARAKSASALTVRIAAGTYDEQVVLVDGVSLLGGYSADFSAHDPAVNVVTFTTSTQERTVVADGLSQPVTIDGVTITGPTLASSDGHSSYGLWINASAQVHIAHATINAGKGSDGASGNAGGGLACAGTSAPGGSAFDCGTTSGAAGAAGGDPIALGTGGAGGTSDCSMNSCPLVGAGGISDGQSGTAGGAGVAGSGGGASGDRFGAFNSSGSWAAAVGDFGSRGLNGTGGGGGGAGGSKHISACFGCSTQLGGRGGDGGLGGCGGGGGQPGGAGGGSFALVVKDSTVILDTVILNGGVGGKGGAGGDGRAGQNGGAGSAGQSGSSAQCGLISYSSGRGGAGGAGGKGGAGGGGAGGVGGVSIALAEVGAATVTKLGGVQLNAGAGGVGGEGGKGPGNAGGSGAPGGAAAERAY